MAGKSKISSGVPEKIEAHILVIEARYYETIADELLDGATRALTQAGATYEVVTVPGALEIPQVLAQAIAAGVIPSDVEGARFDGAIALGCAIEHAREIVYSDGLHLGDKQIVTPIGISCRICERTDCHQRSVPPLERQLSVDPDRRGVLPYDIA